METALNIFLFILFVALGAVIPGAFLTAGFFGKSEKIPAPEAMTAIALLSGLMFQISLWALLRWAGISYVAVMLIHLVITGAPALFLCDKERRAGCFEILRSVFSVETGWFLLAAAALAAYLTYDKVQLYYGDELFRMSLARAAQKSIPLENMLVHSGIMRYYYAAEFFAGSASVVTRIPLETVYFRFMLPLNWTLLFFGMRGILAQYKPDFKRYIPHAAFLPFFLAHVNMIGHFTFRQNSFALGLSVLAMSALWTAISSGARFPLIVCALAPAFISFAKAPCGTLYLFFFCLSLVMVGRSALIGKKCAAAAVLGGTIVWLLVYKSFSGQGFQGTGSLLRIGVSPASMQEFLPEYLIDPGFLAGLEIAFGFAGKLLRCSLETLANGITTLITGLIPIMAAGFWFYLKRGGKAGGPDGSASLNNSFAGPRPSEALAKKDGPGKIMLLSGCAAFIVGAVFFSFIHYRLSYASDRYWLFFSAWMLGAAAYPLLLSEISAKLTARLLALFALVPLISLGVSLTAGPAAIAAGIIALFVLNRRKSGGRAGPGKTTPASAWAVLLAGAVAAFYLNRRFGVAPGTYWWFLVIWMLGAAAYPVFWAEIAPGLPLRWAAFFALTPLAVAAAHLPEYFPEAAQLKRFNGDGWTQYNQEACGILNSEGGDGLYIHNLVNRPNFTLAAVCHGRMYASYSRYRGIWEDKKLYSESHRNAADFFNGKMARPCAWLKKTGIGHVYWDAAGKPYRFAEIVREMKFLSKIYESGNVTLYSAGQCEDRLWSAVTAKSGNSAGMLE